MACLRLAWVLAKLQIRERHDLWQALSRAAARKICHFPSTFELLDQWKSMKNQ